MQCEEFVEAMAYDLTDMTADVGDVFLKPCLGLSDFGIVFVYFLVDDKALCFCCFSFVLLLLRSTSHYINKVINYNIS